MNFLRFLISKIFFKNLAVAVGILVITAIAVLRFFHVYTHHGESISVPDFNGLMFEDLSTLGLEKNYEFILSDSIYDVERMPGSIVAQNPRAGLQVKVGRKVYLTIVALNPEKVSMPNLVDLTLRQSLSVLNSSSLRVGELQYVQDMAKNAVLQQLYNGEVVEPGTKLLKGSEIDLVIGSGNRYNMVKVPFLYGLKAYEAKNVLLQSSLNVGTEDFLDAPDRSVFKVYDQFPACTSEVYVEMGTKVNLQYRSSKLVDFEEYIKQFEPDTTLLVDSLDMEIMNEMNQGF